MRIPRLFLIVMLTSACGADASRDEDPLGGGDGETNGDGSGDDGSDEADDGGGGDDDTKYDVGGGTGGPGDVGEGCEKVDFLFVIDNSASMADEQLNLSTSFPGFIEAIRSSVQAQDYQILILDTDDYDKEKCDVTCGITGECNDRPCAEVLPPNCNGVLGAGRVEDQLGMPCPIQGAQRFLVDGQPALGDTFSCLAQVGTDGSPSERPMQAMVEAVSPALNAPGACNAGFIRDDAILVVTIITDEEDGHNDMQDALPGSLGEPSDWRDALVAAKHGDMSAIVVLGLIGDAGQPGAICAPLNPNAVNGAEATPRLIEFVELFGSRGVVGSVCAPDYAPTFADAVGRIDTACDEFVPPG